MDHKTKYRAKVTLRKYIDNWKEGEGTSLYSIVMNEEFNTIADAIAAFKDDFAMKNEIITKDGRMYVTIQIPKTEDRSIMEMPAEDIITLWMKGKFDMFCLEYELTLFEIAEHQIAIPKDYAKAEVQQSEQNQSSKLEDEEVNLK